MKIALRSHLTSHRTERQPIGAGLVRVTCTICPYTGLEEGPHPIRPVNGNAVPDWMEDAANRFVRRTLAVAS